MIQFLRGIPAPLRKSAGDSIIETLFTEKIALVDLPHKFIAPRFRIYNDMRDLDDYIAHYRQVMFTNSLLREIR